MKQSRIAALILASFMMMSPFSVFAQTATSSQYDNYRWGRGTDASSQAISALGTTAPTSFPIPVLFGVTPSNLSPNFGDPRDGGARTHLGEDIMADKDTPIVSPVAGVVLKNETGASEGNAVYVAIAGGFTLVYMHLDKFAEGVAAGTVVQPGSLLGYVGNTGDAVGGATHLHFEVHDASRAAIDPMPFLSQEFSAQQKISFLNTILSQTSDPNGLAQLLAANFRSTFTGDQNAGISLPPLVISALASVPSSSNTSQLPAGDLTIGSSGPDVVALQRFLIAQQSSAASDLAEAGATGYFGTITRTALSNYQSMHGLFPATGVYTGTTRAMIAPQLSSVSVPAPTPVTAPVPVPNNAIVPGDSSPVTSLNTALTLTRDLSAGMTNSDVLLLQRFLNARGYTIASSGAGSPGQETTYFGPATKAAVIRLQSAHAIAPAVGFVGTITRGVIAGII
ncbi:MAG: hypothetical protein JWM46_449 [Candidatus Kaiserbacteria bacterium]|nr:hypothetical protein [Candidatus Kaiserbacteria bacterium]